MKAITYTEFGGPEVLRLEEVDEPHAGRGQVRLKVVAAGVNPLDSKIRNGWRPQIAPPFPVIPGVEAAGVVDEVGESVTGVAVGDEVLGWTVTGAYAEHALAVDFGPKPADLDWDLAAALPVAVETSVRVLDALGVGEGDTLLLHGAAGVTGAVGVQLAVTRGATVIGTASPGNHDYLRSLGAIPVAYGAGLADRVREAAPRGIDAVYDAAGAGDLEVSIDLRGGTMSSEKPLELRAKEGTLRANAVEVLDRGKRVRFSGGVSVTYLPPGELVVADPSSPSVTTETAE